MPSTLKRILILRGGALGDFIVTLPALRLLREHGPHARIELVGNPRAAELGRATGLLDTVHAQSEARWAQLYDPAPLTPALQTWLDGFDLIVSFWPDPEGELRQHFAARGPAFIADTAPPTTAPAAAHFCNALRPLGLATDDFAFRLNFPADIRAEATRRLAGLENFIALHPGSGSPRKNWPLDRWTEYIARVGQPLLIITGEAEAHHPGRPETETIRHAHEWPLPVLGAALERCAQFVGHDSGISHLAAAAGAACIVLFGPTDPAIWAPPGARVLRHGDSLTAISVDDVLAVSSATPAVATRER